MYKLFVLFLRFCVAESLDIFEDAERSNDQSMYRDSRHCKHRPYTNLEPFYRKSVLECTFYLIFIILLGILFGLLFLGCIKGILGIVVSKGVAEYGLNMLIDLPESLEEYREPELKDRPVCYDVVGWPVHPDTGERTVRTLPLKMEFCLNMVFFLAFPLAVAVQLCSVCCGIGDYKGEDDTCFREVNVIKCKSTGKANEGPNVDTYRDNDLREAKDTRYVINCMRQSQISLGKLRQSRDLS